MGLSQKSNYEKKIVSCFDIGEVPRSPGKWNWNWLYFLPFIFTFEQGEKGISLGICGLATIVNFTPKQARKGFQPISANKNFWGIF